MPQVQAPLVRAPAQILNDEPMIWSSMDVSSTYLDLAESSQTPARPEGVETPFKTEPAV